MQCTTVYLLYIKGALVLSVGLSLASHAHGIRMEQSAALHLLDSFLDQLIKLLRLGGEGLHPVLSELRLKRHNILEALRMADLAGERERRV